MKIICASSQDALLPAFFSERFEIDLTCAPLAQQDFGTRNFLLCPNAIVTLTIDEAKPGATRIPGTHSADVVALKQLRPGVDGAWATSEISSSSPAFNMALSTADCLAVSLVCRMHDKIWGTLFHAGWRGYTKAIHHNAWAQYKEWISHETFDVTEALSNTFAFISPAVFGATYECGMDVKEGLEALEQRHLKQSKAHDSLFFRSLYDGRALGVNVANDEKIYPDLQLMMAYELVALWNIPSSNVTLHRENTFGHALLPSYRYRTLHGGNTKQRLFTNLRLGP